MKKVLSILGGIICGLICVFLFGIQIGFITFTSVKTLVTKDSVSKIVKEMDVKEIISTDPSTTSDLYGAFDTLGFSVEETKNPNALAEALVKIGFGLATAKSDAKNDVSKKNLVSGPGKINYC